MKVLAIVLIVLVAVVFISGCTGDDTPEDEEGGPVTQNDLNELKDGIDDLNPEDPGGPSEG